MRWLLVLLLFFAGLASAQNCPMQDVLFSWTAPVAYDNGDPLPLAEITNFTLYDGASVVDDTIPSTDITLTRLGFSCGSHDFSMTATATSGAESVMSNVVIHDLNDLRKPGAPSLLDVVLAAIIACDSGESSPGFDEICAYYAGLKN